MFKYFIKDGNVVREEVEYDNDDKMWFANRAVAKPAKQLDFYKSMFDRFYTGIGTNKYVMNIYVEYDEMRKEFVYTSSRSRYEVYQATNVTLLRNGLYKLNFDMDKLSDGMPNKKRYKRLYKHMSELLRDCVHNARATCSRQTDYDDFESDYRAIWAVRNALERIYKAKKKLSHQNIKKALMDVDYTAKYNPTLYRFGIYVDDYATEVLELIAESPKAKS